MTIGARSPSVRALVAIAMVAVLGVSCAGAASEPSSDGAPTTLPPEPEATLGIITTNIQVAVDGPTFAPAQEGEKLGQGDQVKTDASGFAEITYHDGSFQRVDHEAILTLTELSRTDTSAAVRTTIDGGRTWNRVRKLTESDDAYEVDTPVASATVRGTVFSTDCPTADSCIFTALEGTIEITPHDLPKPFTLTAPGRLTVTVGQVPTGPETVSPDALRAESWAATNLALDAADPTTPSSTPPGSSPTPTAKDISTASMTGSFVGTRTIEATNLPPSDPSYVEPGDSPRTYVFSTTCDPTCTLQGQTTGDPFPVTFDGTSYQWSSPSTLDCTDGATGEVIMADAATYDFTSTLTPADAQLVDGTWQVTEFTGSFEWIATPKPGDTCTWDSTDGLPYHQTGTFHAVRQAS